MALCMAKIIQRSKSCMCPLSWLKILFVPKESEGANSGPDHQVQGVECGHGIRGRRNSPSPKKENKGTAIDLNQTGKRSAM